jgi:hypothetical protein
VRLLYAAVLIAFAATPANAQVDPALDALVAVYPERLLRHDGGILVFRDGTRMDAGEADPAKPFERLLRDATIRDQFRLPYPRGAEAAPPQRDFDPGRFRDEAFFEKLYGDCRKSAPALVAIAWLPKSWGRRIEVTSLNGVAAHLAEVSAEIDAMPPAIRAAAFPIAGTYSCRSVKDTGRLSMHAYGAAIDLNLKVSDYWLWNGATYRNRMPRQIVDAFERHGFIWGGRWYHYDTMHFEYRPELLALAAPPASR